MAQGISNLDEQQPKSLVSEGRGLTCTEVMIVQVRAQGPTRDTDTQPVVPASLSLSLCGTVVPESFGSLWKIRLRAYGLEQQAPAPAPRPRTQLSGARTCLTQDSDLGMARDLSQPHRGYRDGAKDRLGVRNPISVTRCLKDTHGSKCNSPPSLLK